jgi:hypothetical protein
MGLLDVSARWGARVVVTTLLSVVGCGGDEDTPEPRIPAGDASFGERCSESEDCQSLFCVRVDATGGICTKRCRSDEECPAADNWACIDPDGVRSDVCACRKLGEIELCDDGQDNDCDGQVDDCRICDGVGVPNDDPAHCGACNNACRSDQRCETGSCGCPEDLPDDCGTCVATASDTSHCGTCGNACGTGQTCVDGTCACPDESRPSFCGDSGCLDLTTDRANCGECGNACPTAQSCVDGVCACRDEALATWCDDSVCVDVEADSNHCGDCGNVCTLGRACDEGDCACPNVAAPDFCDDIGCVDLESDERNCGGCGDACRSDELCMGGECGCPADAVDCGGGACVDVSTSVEHCGDCDDACGTAQACVGGECGCTEFGLAICGNDCADFQTDPTHCGGCDQACGAGEVCLQGGCLCESGVVCDGTCVSSTDPANCGACGQACPNGQICSAGACACAGFGLDACGAECVDLSTDLEHCGACGTACRTGESCVSGTCRCPAGQTYCDEAGTCVSLTNDASHCGACADACNPTEVCQSSSCRCPTSGQTYCASAGVCLDTRSNASHCGACDDPCNPTEVCQSGACRCSLSSQRFCATANACVDVVNNSAHCGGCDNACPASTHCANNTCVCDQAGSTLCSGICYDLRSDPAHCGTCLTACTGAFTCLNGLCRCPNPTVGTAVRATNNAFIDASPSLAWDGTHVGVAYTQRGNTLDAKTRFLLLNTDGTVVSDAEIPGANRSTTPDLTWSGSEYALVWRDFGGSRFTRLDAAGVPKQPLVLTLAGGDPGNNKGKVTVTWSSTYGGYAIGGHDVSNSFLQLLGLDASMPQPPNTFTHPSGATGSAQLAAAPAGGWGMAFGTAQGQVGFASFNADGSRTLPVESIGSQIPNDAIGVVHDGTTWLISWVDRAGTGIVVNRGAQANAPAVVHTAAARVGPPAVRVSNGTAAVAWAQVATSSPATYTVRMQRFALPTTSSTLVPIQNPIDVLATPNGQTEEVGIVYTSPTTLLAVWVDNRWGASEIYSAPIDLGACP